MTVDCGLALGNFVVTRLPLSSHTPVGHQLKPDFLYPLTFRNNHPWVGMAAHTCNPSPSEAEAGLQIGG